MVGSADARPPAGGDAPRAFPARRSRRRTSAHPPLAEFGRVASRLALAGLALLADTLGLMMMDTNEFQAEVKAKRSRRMRQRGSMRASG